MKQSDNMKPSSKAEQIETLKLRQQRMRAAINELRQPPVNYDNLNRARTRLADVNYQLRCLGA